MIDAITAAELRYDHLNRTVSFPWGHPMRFNVAGRLDSFEAHQDGIAVYIDSPDWVGEPLDLTPDTLITLGAA